jgi:hypothetical protein
MYVVLGTGSRNWSDLSTTGRALMGVLDMNGLKPNQVLVRHGAAPGADDALECCAIDLGMLTDPMPADWTAPCRDYCKPWHRKARHDGSTYCPAAGAFRNQAMVDLGANVCLAFPLGKSVGTRDCMRRAKAAGIRVVNYGT